MVDFLPSFPKTIKIEFKFLLFAFLSLFILIGIPLGILIGKSRQPQPGDTSAGQAPVYQPQGEAVTVDANSCVTTCNDECKRRINRWGIAGGQRLSRLLRNDGAGSARQNVRPQLLLNTINLDKNIFVSDDERKCPLKR